MIQILHDPNLAQSKSCTIQILHDAVVNFLNKFKDFVTQFKHRSLCSILLSWNVSFNPQKVQCPFKNQFKWLLFSLAEQKIQDFIVFFRLRISDPKVSGTLCTGVLTVGPFHKYGAAFSWKMPRQAHKTTFSLHSTVLLKYLFVGFLLSSCTVVITN